MDVIALVTPDISYLEAVEHASFVPADPFCTGVYEDLLERGLVHLADEGYIISESGRAHLAAYRAT